jgi:hypothetical protein
MSNHGDGHDQNDKDQPGRERALAAQFECAGDRRREFRHDASQDDKRDAITDPARGHLFAEPHQEHGAAGQRDHRRNAEEETRIGDSLTETLKPDTDAIGLNRRQQHCEISGVLVHHLAALLALLLEPLQLRRYRRHQLDNDRGRYVRHDIERKNRHAVNAAAGEHIEHAENTARIGPEDLLPGSGIDAGQRYVRTEPIDDQRTEREPDTLFQFLGLGERREIEIGCQLFRC